MFDEDDELFLRYEHFQGSSPSRISNSPPTGFEPAQSLSSDLVE